MRIKNIINKYKYWPTLLSIILTNVKLIQLYLNIYSKMRKNNFQDFLSF